METSIYQSSNLSIEQWVDESRDNSSPPEGHLPSFSSDNRRSFGSGREYESTGLVSEPLRTFTRL